MFPRALVATVAVTLLLAGCSNRQKAPPPESAYAPAGECARCHSEIAGHYRNVAMARSLYRPTSANVIEDYRRSNHFYHAASGNH